MKPGWSDKLYPVAGLATVVDALEEQGIASLDALAGTHLAEPQLRSPDTRVSLGQVIQCYSNASRLCREPSFAYQTGLRFHLSTYGMYGFAILSSTDFRQSARFAEQYHQLTTPAVDVVFREEGNLAVWAIRPTLVPSLDATTYRFIVELHFGIGVSLHRDVMGRSFVPREMRVTYDSDSPHLQKVVGCPVRCDANEDAWAFDRAWLDGPATLGNEVTYVEVVKLCDRLLHDMRLEIGLAGSVREVLLVNLAQPMALDGLARRLKMPARTLKRKLRQEGTSYRKIVDDLRKQLAIRYLNDTELSLEDIASVLGYAEPAAFRHAFRRWTRESPGKFRRRPRPRKSPL